MHYALCIMQTCRNLYKIFAFWANWPSVMTRTLLLTWSVDQGPSILIFCFLFQKIPEEMHKMHWFGKDSLLCIMHYALCIMQTCRLCTGIDSPLIDQFSYWMVLTWAQDPLCWPSYITRALWTLTIELIFDQNRCLKAEAKVKGAKFCCFKHPV
jgi:hypothetical protein